MADLDYLVEEVLEELRHRTVKCGESETYVTSKQIADNIDDLSTRQVASAMGSLSAGEYETLFVIEDWGYSARTMWHVQVTDEERC